MGSGCSSEPSAPITNYDNQLSSIHSTGSRSKRGKIGHILSTPSFEDSDESFEYNTPSDDYRSQSNAYPSPDEKSIAIETEIPLPSPAPSPRPTPTVPKVVWGVELPVHFKRMLCGRFSEWCPVRSEDKVVRIYHCANFSDSHFERTVLHERLYPRLREYCAEHSCELEVFDFHFGLSDEFVFGHLLRSFGLETLESLTDADKNVILSVFLNEKYGNYWCPTKIEIEWVNSIVKKVTEDDKHFFLSWYQLDENSVPPMYVLQPIEAKITKYGDAQRDVYKEGYREWEKELIRLRNVLCQATGSEFQKIYFTSSIANELQASLFSGRVRPDNTMWIKRTLRSWNLENSSPYLGYYFDLNRDRLDESAQLKLKNLSNYLSDRLEPKHKLAVEVAWDGEKGIDPNLPCYKKYLERVCEKYEATAKEIIERVVQLKLGQDQWRIKMSHKGLSRTLYSDLIDNSHHCQRLAKSLIPRSELIQTLENYINQGHSEETTNDEAPLGSVPPLLLHGPEGSGKSSLAAVLAQQVCSLEGWTGCVCVMRFIGCSIGCETLEDVLMSVGEQIGLLCQIQSTSIYKKPFKDMLHWLLPQVPKSMPLLIIIDGLERIDGNGEDDLNWLPLDLPSHIRILMTALAGSKPHRRFKKSMSQTDALVEISYLDDEEKAALLESCLKANQRTLTEEQNARVMEQIAGDVTPMMLVLAAEIVSKWSSQDTDLDFDFSHIKAMAGIVLDDLEEHFGRKLIAKVMLYLLCSRNGVNCSEMNDLLSSYIHAIESGYKFGQIPLQKMPSLIWCIIKKMIRFFSMERTQKGIPLTSLHCISFRKLVEERYKNGQLQATTELLAYFDGRMSRKHFENRKSADKDRLKGIRHSLLKSQPLRWKNCENHRKLSEKPYLLAKLGCDKQYLTDCIFNWEWLEACFSASSVKNVLRDIELYESLKSTTGAKDLIFLKKFITDIKIILVIDPCQFASQLVMALRTGHTSIHENLIFCNALCENMDNSLPTLLMPTDTYIPFRESNQESVITGLFRVKNDENHIISVATTLGEMAIWNIHRRQPVRTIRGLNQPKEVKTLDLMKAVVLCNRELIVYDLDKGCQIIKLKGVLNIRMPYFGVHDRDHTIAMARNRMYVNVMSNITGEMVTTFKVGEDRFLNSLLVSDQGNICVCGDAVQKPFPLLVWDLHSRKLIYDLRIQGHEFLTKMAAITNEGHYVVCVAREIEDPDPNFILVYDLQSGSVFKKWKRDYSTTCVAISSRTSQVVSGHEDGSVVVWDLVSGTLKYELRGHSRGPDAIRMSDNGTHCITYDTTCRDTNVWHWSVSEGIPIGCFCTTTGVNYGEISADGGMVILSLPGRDEIVTLLPPGRELKADDTGVFGDASREGRVYDLSSTSSL